jgi:hypothetical protein
MQWPALIVALARCAGLPSAVDPQPRESHGRFLQGQYSRIDFATGGFFARMSRLDTEIVAAMARFDCGVSPI